MKMDRFLDWIFPLAGLAILAFGIYSFVNTIIFVNGSATTEGTVVGVESKPVDLEHGNMDFLTVRFATEGGRSVVFTSNTREGSLFSEWRDRIGESVTVRYDPADPTNARIDSDVWPGSIIALILGGVFILSGRGWFIRKFPISSKGSIASHDSAREDQAGSQTIEAEHTSGGHFGGGAAPRDGDGRGTKAGLL